MQRLFVAERGFPLKMFNEQQRVHQITSNSIHVSVEHNMLKTVRRGDENYCILIKMEESDDSVRVEEEYFA